MEKTHIYLIGIGGIGMSALARYFLSHGKAVAGYDRVKTVLCEQLESEGMAIHYYDDVNLIPEEFKNITDTVVIYTPAIPQGHSELDYFRENGFELLKRAQVLGKIAQRHTCLAIAGTHGKTTTSALLAHLFKNAGKNVTAFMGGISTNYQSNFLAGDDQDGSILIAEADEYDRSFLQLHPSGAVITSVDPDHLDVYGNTNELMRTFGEFASSVSDHLIVKDDLNVDGISYGLNDDADYSAMNIRIINHTYHFDLHGPDIKITDIKCGLPGRHNIENALGAAALGLQYSLNSDQIKSGIETFRGVKRRFEYHIKTDNLIFIDDYAHHPKEIDVLITSVKELYPNKKITGIFQPHLYSRTCDFAVEFAESLSELDELILMEIYGARERPLPGVNSGMLLEKVNLSDKKLLQRREILSHLRRCKTEVILTIGAGDIDQLIPKIKQALLNE